MKVTYTKKQLFYLFIYSRKEKTCIAQFQIIDTGEKIQICQKGYSCHPKIWNLSN